MTADDGDRDDGTVVELIRLPDRFEADVIAAKLRSAGIAVAFGADDADGWYPPLGQTHGYRIFVASEDLDDARALLSPPHRAGPVHAHRRPRPSA